MMLCQFWESGCFAGGRSAERAISSKQPGGFLTLLRKVMHP